MVDYNSDPEVQPSSIGANHLSQKELAERWRISPRTLERWRAARTGPPWLRLGTRRVAYRLEDVLAFERARLEGRPTGGNDA